jgi:hypothetical protein
MAQKASKNNHANDNSQAQIMPTDRLDFLTAVAMDHGINARNSLAARAAVVILKHRHNETGNIVLKYSTIAAEMGCSVSAVRDAVAVLKERGWYIVEPVYIDRECVANRYIPCWDEAAAVGRIWSIKDRKITVEKASDIESEILTMQSDMSSKMTPPVNSDEGFVLRSIDPCPPKDRSLSSWEQTTVLRRTFKTQSLYLGVFNPAF